MFNNPTSSHWKSEAGSLNKKSCLAAALSVKEFMTANAMILDTLLFCSLSLT
jgi:hypothetical protein